MRAARSPDPALSTSRCALRRAVSNRDRWNVRPTGQSVARRDPLPLGRPRATAWGPVGARNRVERLLLIAKGMATKEIEHRSPRPKRARHPAREAIEAYAGDEANELPIGGYATMIAVFMGSFVGL